MSDQNKTCQACHKPIEDDNWVTHHTSYFPEIKVPVHMKCHREIHFGSLYFHLKPLKEDVSKFYNKGKILVRPQVSEKNYKDVLDFANENSQTYVDDIDSAISILLTLLTPNRKKK